MTSAQCSRDYLSRRSHVRRCRRSWTSRRAVPRRRRARACTALRHRALLLRSTSRTMSRQLRARRRRALACSQRWSRRCVRCSCSRRARRRCVRRRAPWTTTRRRMRRCRSNWRRRRARNDADACRQWRAARFDRATHRNWHIVIALSIYIYIYTSFSKLYRQNVFTHANVSLIAPSTTSTVGVVTVIGDELQGGETSCLCDIKMQIHKKNQKNQIKNQNKTNHKTKPNRNGLFLHLNMQPALLRAVAMNVLELRTLASNVLFELKAPPLSEYNNGSF